MSDSRFDSPEFSETSLAGMLRSVRSLKVFLEIASVVLLAFACLLGAALVAVYLDAVLALPTPARIAVNVLFSIGALWSVGLMLRSLFLNRFDPRRLARLVEDRLGLENSVFINGVEFAGAEQRTGSSVLRARAVRMAHQHARKVSSLDVVPVRPLYRSFMIAAAALLLLAGAWLTAPRLFGAVVPRYLDPHGDHPPYTLVTFDVTISPEPVYHGRPAEISVKLGGPEAIDQARVVFLSGEERESLPMYRTGEQQFALQIDKAARSRDFYIDTPRGRSPTRRLDVLEVPWFEETHVGYVYPGYTGWPAAEQPLTDRGIHALVGTEVTLTIRSNLPLQSGRLQLTPGDAGSDGAAHVVLHPVPEDPRTVTGTFPIEFSGRFQLDLVAVSGARSAESLEGPLEAVPDRHPHVAIVEPGARVIAVEDWQVPVTVEAVDDVGISRIRLYRSVNGWGPTPVDLALESSQPNRASARSEFDLAALGSRAGDVITYYASAYDNHPGGEQFADSELCVIQVISKSEYEQFARQQYQMDELVAEFEAIREQLDRMQQERNELLEELETLRKQLEESEQPGEELQQRMEELQKQLSEYSESAEQLAERLQKRTEQLQLYELEEPYTEQLQKLSKQLEKQSQNADAVQQQLENLASNPTSPESRQSLDDALETLRKENEPFDQQTQQQLQRTESDLELYKMADDMVAAAERMRSIITRQRELADRLGEFRNSSSVPSAEQSRIDRLAAEQELLEQELQEAAREMEQAAQRAEERLPQMAGDALGLCRAINDLQIPQDQQLAAQQARQGAGQQAHESADAAARNLESLLSKCTSCEGACNSMSDSLDGPLRLPADQLQQCLNQLAQGRGIPGVGGRPGSGTGQGNSGGGGASGGVGTADRGGAGNAAGMGWRPGQSFPGSQAPVTVLGPMTEQTMRMQRAGSTSNDDRGGWLPFGANDDPRAAESLNPVTREASQSGVGNLRGVPAGYREAAEAYFRRLSEGK